MSLLTSEAFVSMMASDYTDRCMARGMKPVFAPATLMTIQTMLRHATTGKCFPAWVVLHFLLMHLGINHSMAHKLRFQTHSMVGQPRSYPIRVMRYNAARADQQRYLPNSRSPTHPRIALR